jgi:hypothetical protein
VRRTLCSAALLVVAVAPAGCGDDEKKSSGGSTVERVYRVPTTGQTTPEDVQVPPPATTPKTETTPPAPATTPDEGGDEEPARTEVTLNASRAGISPRRAGVAPFIAVRITLVSKDGSSHTLSIAGKRLSVGGTRKSAFVELSGLRPGRSYRGVFDGRVKVRVFGSAEPGP